MLQLTTIAHTRKQASDHSNSSAGMSLAELLVAVSLSMLLTLTVATFYLTFAKATLSMSSYSDYDRASGKLVQIFSRDVREAESITWISSNQFRLLKKSANYTYTYDPEEQIVTRQETGESSVTLASNVSELEFNAYNNLGVEIAQGIDLALLSENTKMLQIVGKFSSPTPARTPTSANIITARYILRNKDVPNP